MADKPGGEVALSALATTANKAKQPKKGRQTYQDHHLKERATTNEAR